MTPVIGKKALLADAVPHGDLFGKRRADRLGIASSSAGAVSGAATVPPLTTQRLQYRMP
ncbi:hypothetical protein [Neorhizobium sp. T25_13]|uniref:hypothetical protein n=1 Tax=Neorhizobium sp. T25_13 TaxID=2093830 RepID=UPI00155DF2C9|nr:hypothetical protein [Neorhizobium sp. T25_13]